MINKLFKSVIDQDNAPIVICDVHSKVVYMNPASVKRYKKDITGMSIKDCHNGESNQKIDRVLAWFAKDRENNKVYTFHSERENKDVYMIALRDGAGELIGYYEKHEYRDKETSDTYDI
ncbi:MAG: fatty acid/phospholipid synthesis protein PlsX [Clostridia bacterium]|nr:fatty acid/phospholipid synthesis protein PlsX [Clostridia bacterium]